MVNTLCVILGGGRGTRLFPLTKERSKPAVPLAGKYRLIDIPVSNCLNSGINKIYVLTQFNSESLNKHVGRTYNLDRFSGGFVEILAADQSMESTDWFQGTADAVRQSMKHFMHRDYDKILILSGDQLYKLNFREMFEYHDSMKAEITVACNPVDPDEILEFGIMGTDKEGRIKKFVEKPRDIKAVDDISVAVDGKKQFLASMGIYLFEKNALIELLTRSKSVDFGKEVIPSAFMDRHTYAFTYRGYWKDIGTIKALYEANLMLTGHEPPINMFDENWPFFTRPRNLPPAKVIDSRIDSSMIADGCLIEKSAIKHSVIGLRSMVGRDSRIEETILMGNDYYRDNIKIGSGCQIRKAIVDKNVHIGNNVRIINRDNLETKDGENYFIRENIVIIPKNAVISDGTVI